jgi:iron complex outermembrane receptor protein
MEGRLELVQTKRGGWDGVLGGQIMFRKAAIEGEEKFLPNTDTETFGLFTLQSLDLGDVRLEAGGRYEHNQVAAAADAVLGNPDITRRFNTFSGSLGASYRLAGDWRLGVNLSRSERAPTADELFARGNHAGTQAFELGDPNFGTERGWGVEATLHGSGPGYHLSFTGYYNRFKGFIFDRMVDNSVCEAANGGAEMEFPCFQFSQAPARYLGFEAQADAHIATIGGGEIHVDGLADYVRATVKGYGPAPRIPPLRLRGGVSWEAKTLTARVETEHDFAQKRVGGLETTTPAFTLVNASLAWSPLGTDKVSLLLSGNNLFDVVARRHASILKDYAPLAGRDIRLTLSLKI